MAKKPPANPSAQPGAPDDRAQNVPGETAKESGRHAPGLSKSRTPHPTETNADLDSLTKELEPTPPAGPRSPEKIAPAPPASAPAAEAPVSPAEPGTPAEPAVAGGAAVGAEASEDAAEGSRHGRFSVLEMIGLGGIAAVFVGFAVFFFSGLAGKNAESARDRENPAVRTPETASGELVSLSAIETYWRPWRPDDRADPSHGLLPELAFTVTPKSSTGTTFIKIHFLDPEGSISGDVRSTKVESGSLVEIGRGDDVVAPDRVRVTGSRGMRDETEFLSYRFGDQERWSVEIFESSNYSEGPWNRLAYFRVASEIRKDEEDPEAEGKKPTP